MRYFISLTCVLTDFIEHKHLGAARDFFERVKVEDLISVLADRDVGESAEDYINELLTNEHVLLGEIHGASDAEQLATQTRLALAVKNMWELQSFVMALDGIETVGTIIEFAREYVDFIIIQCAEFGVNIYFQVKSSYAIEPGIL